MSSTRSSDLSIGFGGLRKRNKENMSNLFNHFPLFSSTSRKMSPLTNNYKENYIAADNSVLKRRGSYKVAKPLKKKIILNEELPSVPQHSPFTMFESDSFLFSPKLYSYSQTNIEGANFMAFRNQQNPTKKGSSTFALSKVHLQGYFNLKNLTRFLLAFLTVSKILLYLCFPSVDVLFKIDQFVSFLWQLSLLFQLIDGITYIDFQVKTIVEKPYSNPDYILSLVYVLFPLLLYLALLAIQMNFAEYPAVQKVIFSNLTISLVSVEYAHKHYSKVWKSYVAYTKSLEKKVSTIPVVQNNSSTASPVYNKQYMQGTKSSNKSGSLSIKFSSSVNNAAWNSPTAPDIRSKSKLRWKSTPDWQSIHSAIDIGSFFYYRACVFVIKAPFKVAKALLKQVWNFKKRVWETGRN
ncbi:hypothetical protein ACO0QE_000538 [Hanseniaspora vineae]